MGEVSYLPLIEEMTWSYSRIETFDSCPYRFFLKYIDGCEEADQFFSTYGSFIHRLIEGYYTGKFSKEEMLTEYLVGFSKNVRGIRPQQSTVEKYIKSGANYLRSFQPFPYRMVDVEKKVRFSVDGLPFVGVIDYLGEKDGGLYIVDNKSRDLKPRSRKATPTAKDKELDAMLRQLYLYAAAVQQEFGEFPKALCFNCYRTGVFIEEPFREESYEETIAWTKKKVEEIKAADDFYPNIDYFLCHYICGVNGGCIYHQMTKEGRGKP